MFSLLPLVTEIVQHHDDVMIWKPFPDDWRSVTEYINETVTVKTGLAFLCLLSLNIRCTNNGATGDLRRLHFYMTSVLCDVRRVGDLNLPKMAYTETRSF